MVNCFKKNKPPDLLCFQRKLPEQDIAQGSYIALPLTLLLLLAGYNHDKVGQGCFCSYPNIPLLSMDMLHCEGLLGCYPERTAITIPLCDVL